MKKCLLVIIFMFSSAFASDFNLFNESSKAWLGAISASLGMRFDKPLYLPDYGILLVGESCASIENGWSKDFDQIKSLTSVLGATIKGIDAKESLSIVVNYRCGDFGNQVIARIKGTDIIKGNWEVWINGVLQK